MSIPGRLDDVATLLGYSFRDASTATQIISIGAEKKTDRFARLEHLGDCVMRLSTHLMGARLVSRGSTVRAGFPPELVITNRALTETLKITAVWERLAVPLGIHSLQHERVAAIIEALIGLAFVEGSYEIAYQSTAKVLLNGSSHRILEEHPFGDFRPMPDHSLSTLGRMFLRIVVYQWLFSKDSGLSHRCRHARAILIEKAGAFQSTIATSLGVRRVERVICGEIARRLLTVPWAEVEGLIKKILETVSSKLDSSLIGDLLQLERGRRLLLSYLIPALTRNGAPFFLDIWRRETETPGYRGVIRLDSTEIFQGEFCRDYRTAQRAAIEHFIQTVATPGYFDRWV